MQIKINPARLADSLNEFSSIGKIADTGVERLTLSEEDRQARELLVDKLKNLGLNIFIDKIGNIFGLRNGIKDLPPVMFGSHLDTVGSGGRYDGSYGVIAGLELIETLNENKIETEKPLVLAMFTNEEGVRFQPDMMGSLVYSGQYKIDDALNTVGTDGTILGDELKKIGFAGKKDAEFQKPSAFIELHVEQGPVLDSENYNIGAVENLMGISWQEITVTGQANHAGTTPMNRRQDAGLAASKIISYVRHICETVGGNQRGTCGSISFSPNMINIIPQKAVFTVDLRNSTTEKLLMAENLLTDFIEKAGKDESVTIERKQLVRFDPVQFDPEIVTLIESAADNLGLSHRRMTSGAGHDAQMLSAICPSAMIFIPSKDGISHNPAEYSTPQQLEDGANVLLHTILKLAGKQNS